MRFDFEGISTEVADKLMADLEQKLPSLAGKTYGPHTVKTAAPFVYNDPVDGSSTKNGLVIDFTQDEKITFRLSGTGSSGATLRVYIERLENHKFKEDPKQMLAGLFAAAMEIAEIEKRTGKKQADVNT